MLSAYSEGARVGFDYPRARRPPTGNPACRILFCLGWKRILNSPIGSENKLLEEMADAD